MSQHSLNAIRRILDIFHDSKGEIRPHFIVTGPSGAGKSHNIEMLCNDLEIPMLTVNAAGLTKEGTAGNSLSKALSPLMQYGDRPVICFVDEFDKLFISGNNNSALAHETTNGVQNEFLKALEGIANVASDYGKYVNVPTDNVLFVFAGAFNGEENIDIDRLREMGLKTEFLGRVGLAYGLEKITLDQLRNILENSNLLAKYLDLFNDVQKDVVVDAVMDAIEANYDQNPIGARIVTTLLNQYFIEGGLNKKEVKKTTFQRKLSLNGSPTKQDQVKRK